jgi:hypothetical protein
MKKCNIHGCKKPAEFEVILYDVYPYDASERPCRNPVGWATGLPGAAVMTPKNT